MEQGQHEGSKTGTERTELQFPPFMLLGRTACHPVMQTEAASTCSTADGQGHITSRSNDVIKHMQSDNTRTGRAQAVQPGSRLVQADDMFVMTCHITSAAACASKQHRYCHTSTEHIAFMGQPLPKLQNKVDLIIRDSEAIIEVTHPDGMLILQ